MNIAPPPDEEWVLVGYLDLAGQPQEFRAEWTIIGLPPEADAVHPDAPTAVAAAFGLDLEGDTFRRINKVLFAQNVVKAKKELATVRRMAREATMTSITASAADAATAESEAAVRAVQGTTDSTMPDVFLAKVISVGGRNYAYIRIFTFAVGDDNAFVNEFLRLMELPQMPKDGLIVDVRGNGGGLIWAGERLLQLFTARPIEPCRAQFINTTVNALLCQNVDFLGKWAASLDRAVETGTTFSASFPITPPELCNDIGQRYYGPVLLITDARCYSTTDIFIAGFRDHKIGPILGTDNNTGAGGANVWTHQQILNFFAGANVTPPLQQLPKGASMRVAIRRTIRVGDEVGTELEDLGVVPDQEHQLTRDDILNDNPDLLARAAQILSTEIVRSFNVAVTRKPASLAFKLFSNKVDYIDISLNGRPRRSNDITAPTIEFELPQNAEFVLPAAPVAVELRGYAKTELVCYRRLQA